MKRSVSSTLRLLSRGAWLTTGVVLFFWFGYEDRGLASVVACAVLLCLALGLTYISRFSGEQARFPGASWTRSMLFGVLVGAGVGPVSALLIIIKIGLHAHPVLDFDPQDLARVLKLSPVWGLSGGLLGLALGLGLRQMGDGSGR
jgi:hypothetical protein